MFQEPWPLEEKKTEEKPVENTAKPHKDNVQQAKSKKESKVKTPEPKKAVKVEKTVSETVSNSEEQLPGQDNIMNHPEFLPDNMKEQEVLTGEVEDIENPANTDNDNERQANEGMKVEHFAPVQESRESTIRGYKAAIKAAVHIIEDKCDKGDWAAVTSKATAIVWNAKKIQELEGKN